MAWAEANGIASGMGSNNFAPENTLSREQLAVMLYNYAKYKGLDVNVADTGVMNGYSDTGSVSSWAEDAIKWAVSFKIIYGNGAGLNAQGNATRAEVSAILERFIKSAVLK